MDETYTPAVSECPSCASQNSDGARFCSSCGSPVVAPSASVRKTVTVVFCDLVGSTAMGDGADPEVLRGQMAQYHRQLKTILELHGGTVEKFIGDAAMAVFGLPSAHEDDALRALRAAVEMRSAVGTLGFEVRIGINTGEVVAGEGETLVTGDAVNIAARLEQAARAGEILVGELTERLVRDAVRTDRLEPLVVKGKAAPVTAYRVLEVDPHLLPVRRADAPFVGREHELEQLRAALYAAVTGQQPQLATIVGPPGIGKSRLVRELIDTARARIVAGRCLAYGQGITYWPLQEIVEQIGDVRAAMGDGDDSLLAAARIDAFVGVGAASSDEIAWGFRKLFEAVAQTQPLIVVVDDIHWAEPTLLDLLEYLADFSRDAALLILCTARPELLDNRPSWNGPRPNAVLISLEPLPTAQVEMLVEQLGKLQPTDRERIIEAAEGNPLFLEQLVAMSAEHAEGGPLEIPPTIQALLAARIDRLAAGERSVVERAAVEGRMFHRGSVRELMPEAARPEVGRTLLSLVRRQFIHPDQAQLPGDDAFRFDHVLIRDAAYESLPKQLRADLHERFARWLEDRLGPTGADEILGYHLEQAFQYRSQLQLPLGDLGERAAAKLGAAGLAAAARGDVRAQVNLLERAAALLPAAAASRRAILADLGEAFAKSGNEDRAIECLREAETLAENAADVHTEWLARLGRVPIEVMRDPQGAAESLLSHANAAIAALPDDHEVAARAWRMIGSAHDYRGQMLEEHRANQTAWQHARQTGDVMLETEIVRNSGAPIAFGPVPVDEGLLWVSEVLERAPNAAFFEGWSQHMFGHLRARLGEFEAAREAIEAWRTHLRELGQESVYHQLVGCLWDVCSLAEDWVFAERALREADESFGRSGDKGHRSAVAPMLGEALFRQGKLDEAERYSLLSEELSATDDVAAQALWRGVRAKVLAARGQVEPALGLAKEAVAILTETDFLDWHAQACLDLASLLREAGDRDAARAAAGEAVALYTRRGNLVGIARAQASLASA